MTNLLRTRFSRALGNSHSSATACAGEAAAEGNATARLGDELLRHLPADRRSSALSVSLAEATYKITGDRMDRLFHSCAALAVGRDTFFLTAFATLLARLAGQDAVILRICCGDPAILSLAFDAEASFRGLLSATKNAELTRNSRALQRSRVFCARERLLGSSMTVGLWSPTSSVDSALGRVRTSQKARKPR